MSPEIEKKIGECLNRDRTKEGFYPSGPEQETLKSIRKAAEDDSMNGPEGNQVCLRLLEVIDLLISNLVR